MGYHVHIHKWTELIGRLHALGFDRCDYAAFKFLALYQKIEDQGKSDQPASVAQRGGQLSCEGNLEGKDLKIKINIVKHSLF